MEKYLLRKAFDWPDQPYLPERVLWRQKEQFSDGVGYDWVDGLKAHAARVRLPSGSSIKCSCCGPGRFSSCRWCGTKESASAMPLAGTRMRHVCRA